MEPPGAPLVSPPGPPRCHRAHVAVLAAPKIFGGAGVVPSSRHGRCWAKTLMGTEMPQPGKGWEAPRGVDLATCFAQLLAPRGRAVSPPSSKEHPSALHAYFLFYEPQAAKLRAG